MFCVNPAVGAEFALQLTGVSFNSFTVLLDAF